MSVPPEITANHTPEKNFIKGLYYAGRDPAYVFLHGFTATPEEHRFLAADAHSAGNRVVVPLLPGHGTNPQELGRTRWSDWYRATEEAVLVAGGSRAPVIVVGQSLGGLLALHLAVRRPEWVEALVLLAPAIFLRAWWLEKIAPVLPFLAWLRPYWPKGPSDIADPQARVARVGYDSIPLRALRELVALQRVVRAEVSCVRHRTLIVQSRLDHTCRWRGVEFLCQHLRGPVQTLVLEKSFHVVSLDCEREQVASAIREFAAALRG
ncbi:MAG: carboxylesterase [Candidatus Binatia bacterium]|nr:MAG: carboxylesterase [Candidatus Binatia bacterium]